MQYLISTYCNQYKGDFLINHWLRSLRLHVNLTGIDIMVIDFGLSEMQVAELLKQGVIVNRQAPPEGRMSNVQYRYLSEYLKAHPQYTQVLYCDCGDVIFQQDISHLFTQSPGRMRLALEKNFNFYLHWITLGFKDVRKEKIRQIQQVIGNRPTANCGFVLGPAGKMASIWEEYQENCMATNVHGTDQLIINYMIYRDGFEVLDETYNYVTFLKKQRLSTDGNHFFRNNNGLINVVHNAGKYDFARAIADFGYRQGAVKPAYQGAFFRYYYKLGDWVSRFLFALYYR